MSERYFPFRLCGAVALVAIAATLSGRAAPGIEPTVEELKARLSSSSGGDRPHLCVQIAERQLAAADKLYADADNDKAQPALTDVVAYSELARDYAIQSHKREKQTEIAVRGMMRKLTEIMHSLGQADQPPVRDAINRLQRVRDDLLAAMFRKGAQ
jgi:hypothetical protein